MSEAQGLDWVQIAQGLATAPPEVRERLRAALAEREEEPKATAVLELDRRASEIRRVLPTLRHQHAQALLYQDGKQARTAYSELVDAVTDAISAVGWQQVRAELQGLQLLMGQPWGLGVFTAGVNRADAADLDGVLANVATLAGLAATLATPPPSDGTDRAVAQMVGEVREAEGPKVTDRILPDSDCELTWFDMDLWLEVGAYLAEHEAQLWRSGGQACWRRAAWIFRFCWQTERDRKPDEPRRGPFELLRPQPKERPTPPRPISLLEQLQKARPGMTHGELAHLLRKHQLAMTGRPEHTVALPQMVRGVPLR